MNTGEMALVEGIRALLQIGVSAVFIWAWYRERLINVDVVNSYMRIREKNLETEAERLRLETERIKMEYVKYIRSHDLAHLTKTDIPDKN